MKLTDSGTRFTHVEHGNTHAHSISDLTASWQTGIDQTALARFELGPSEPHISTLLFFVEIGDHELTSTVTATGLPSWGGRLADVQYSKCALFLISWTRATGSEAPTLNTGSKDRFDVPHDAPVVSRPA